MSLPTVEGKMNHSGPFVIFFSNSYQPSLFNLSFYLSFHWWRTQPLKNRIVTCIQPSRFRNILNLNGCPVRWICQKKNHILIAPWLSISIMMWITCFDGFLALETVEFKTTVAANNTVLLLLFARNVPFKSKLWLSRAVNLLNNYCARTFYDMGLLLFLFPSPFLTSLSLLSPNSMTLHRIVAQETEK